MSILIKGVDMPEKHHMDCYYIDHDGRVLNISRNKVIGEAIQYEERKKGKWCGAFCSVCGERCDYHLSGTIWIDELANYCPNCGAEMREKNKTAH